MNVRLHSISVVLAVVLGLAGWHAASERFSLAPGSRIWVEGTSTVHDWSCDAEQLSATLDATMGDETLSGLSALTVTVPVAGMDCDNGTMNGKLRRALGSSDIRFTLSDARVGTVNTGRFGVEANGQLTIHGTSLSQRVMAEGRAVGNGQYRFTGSVPVTMSAFGVEPPTALLGTLHTGDRVTVRFDVTITR